MTFALRVVTGSKSAIARMLHTSTASSAPIQPTDVTTWPNKNHFRVAGRILQSIGLSVRRGAGSRRPSVLGICSYVRVRRALIP
ncbi:hypothetical protein GCM10027360_41080 [Amycolatopsis echigonensis]